MNTLSIQRPRPSIEILIPAARSVSVKVALVNREPWSVLKISGRPNRASASSRASTQKLVSRVFPENAASRLLCRAVGFREVGVYERHARLDGVWRDCVIVERLLGPAPHR